MFWFIIKVLTEVSRIEELYYRFTDCIAAWILICVIHVSV